MRSTAACAIFICSGWLLAESIYISVAADAAKRTVLSGKINYMSSVLASAGLTLFKMKLPSRISRVRAGSPGFYAGLTEDDTVTELRPGNGILDVFIERRSKKYFVRLSTESRSERAATEVSDKGPAKDESRRTLFDYDVYLLVDKSESMGSQLECGLGTRLKWCKDQILALIAESRKEIERGVSIVPFDEEFRIFPLVKGDSLRRIVGDLSATGSTDCALPVDSILEQYFRGDRTHPMLIAILTDGIPTKGRDIKQAIIDATQRMHASSDVRISFLEIGSDIQGQVQLKEWDDELVKQGARFDIVNVVPFDQLRKIGLRDALLRALR